MDIPYLVRRRSRLAPPGRTVGTRKPVRGARSPAGAAVVTATEPADRRCRVTAGTEQHRWIRPTPITQARTCNHVTAGTRGAAAPPLTAFCSSTPVAPEQGRPGAIHHGTTR